MGIRHMEGVPWHLEYAFVEHEEGEVRRHKKRCRYYRSDNRCRYGDILYCCGSGKCDVYLESEQEHYRSASCQEPEVMRTHLKVKDKKLNAGTLFKVRDCETNEIEIYEIVHPRDVDFEENKIAGSSPLVLEVAKANTGEIVEINDDVSYEVLKVTDENAPVRRTERPGELSKLSRQVQRMQKKKRKGRSRNKIRINDDFLFKNR